VRWFLVLLAIAAVSALILLAQPAPQPGPAASSKLIVAATIFPLADWLREVGGADVEVHCLVSGGSNPHHFEPAIGDAVLLARARALFAVGLGLDEWAQRLAVNSGRGRELAFLETGSWIKPLAFHEAATHLRASEAAAHRKEGVEVDLVHEHERGQYDPHYWLDPQRACAVVSRMARELSALDPAHRDGYERRAKVYLEKLKALDDDLTARARGVPSGAQIVSFHDAYGYLLDRLRIGLAAAIQTSPGVEPSARDASEAIRVMRQNGQRVVFQEPMDSSQAARTIAQELGASLQVLDPLDNEASSVGKTYLERVRHDINVLADAVAK